MTLQEVGSVAESSVRIGCEACSEGRGLATDLMLSHLRLSHAMIMMAPAMSFQNLIAAKTPVL